MRFTVEIIIIDGGLPGFLGAFCSGSLRVHISSSSQCQSYFMTGDLPPISSSWWQAPWDPRSVFFSKLTLAVIVLMQRPLWRKDGSVVYNCYLPSLAQSFSGPIPAGLLTIFYCLILETPRTWKARSPYLYPPGTEWPGYNPRHWFPFSSPHTTRRATVYVFDPDSMQEKRLITNSWLLFINFTRSA
jgi:hypothetical protein